MDVDSSTPNPKPPSNASRVTSALQERILLYSSLWQKQPGSFGEHLLDIELELWDIETALAIFRRQRNALVPVARFPPEILSSIFYDLAELEPHYLQHPAEYDDIFLSDFDMDIGWIKVTQVCHAWREAAFGDSRLWTAATSLLGKSWFERMLQLGRFQPRQLDLILDGGLLSTYPQFTASPDLLDKASRLRIISGGGDLSDLADLKAPAVESLHVHADFNEGRHSFPNSLFGGVTAQLQDLYVHNMDVRLTAQFINSLTHISLSTTSRLWIEFQELASTLSSMVSLESFTMQYYLSDILDEDIPATDPMEIICPRLTYVNVYANWTAVFLLMARLRAPTTARMTFTATYPDPSAVPNASGALILDAFRRRMLSPDASPVRDMQTIEWRGRAPHSWRDKPVCDGPAAPCYEKSVILSTWRDNCSDRLLRDYQGYSDHPSCPDFQLVLETRPGSESPILNEVVPFAAFPSARCLSIHPVHRVNFAVSFDNGWQELFRTALTLEWLRVDREVGEELVSAAYSDITYPTYKGSSSFPETLRTLAMLGIRWDHNDEVSDHPVHYMLNEIGALSNVGEVIVGEASAEDEMMGLEWSTLTLTTVKRPEWFTYGHEDWDNLADF